jgi:thioredoxin 1
MSRKSFQTMLVNNETPVLVMFYAPWCTYCQAYLPVLEEIAEKFGDKLQVIKVNVDKNVAAALRYSIRATPSFMYFHKGQALWKKAGQLSRSELSDKLYNLLALEGVY